MTGFLDSLARYQEVMKQLQTQAKKLMMEIKTTHSRVLQSLAESHVAKKNFLDLKHKAELILGQLQEEARQADYSQQTTETSQFPLYATVRKDRSKRGGGSTGRVARNTVAEQAEESLLQLRVHQPGAGGSEKMEEDS